MFHQKWWLSIAMLNYQRVLPGNLKNPTNFEDFAGFYRSLPGALPPYHCWELFPRLQAAGVGPEGRSLRRKTVGGWSGIIYIYILYILYIYALGGRGSPRGGRGGVGCNNVHVTCVKGWGGVGCNNVHVTCVKGWGGVGWGVKTFM